MKVRNSKILIYEFPWASAEGSKGIFKHAAKAAKAFSPSTRFVKTSLLSPTIVVLCYAG